MITCGLRAAAEAQAARLAQHVHHFFVDDLDDLFARLQRLVHLFAKRARTNVFDEVLDDRQGDISLKQRHAHFAHDGFNIGFFDAPTLAQAFKGGVESLTQGFKHGSSRRNKRARILGRESS